MLAILILSGFAAALYLGRRWHIWDRLMQKRRKFPYPVEEISGAFRGVRENPDLDPGQSDRSFAESAQNVYARASEFGSGQFGRPGFTRVETQLGAGAVRQGQAIAMFTTLAGVDYRFVFCGGKVYRGSADLQTWTDVTPTTPTISTTARIYTVTFADVLIVSDGTNRPWKLTSPGSTPVVGTYLTDVPGALYGPPVVYYAKLFGIKADERSTIIWSEENDPMTGYEAGANDNAWTLGQTDQDALFCLGATNAALYYWRAYSIGAISGAVESDFQNAGVHDSVSTLVGTSYPACVVQRESEFHFIDTTGKPHALAAGQLVSMWKDSRVSLRAAAATPAGMVSGWQSDLDLILHGYTATGAFATQAHVFDPVARTYQGIWVSGIISAWHVIGQLKNASGNMVTVVLGQELGVDPGWLHIMGLESANTVSDVKTATSTAVVYSVTGPFMLADSRVQKCFTELSAAIRGGNEAWRVSHGYLTSLGSGSTQNATFSARASDGLAGTSTVGINAFGMYLQPVVTVSVKSDGTTPITKRFGLYHFRVRGSAISDAPGAT